MMNGTIAQAHHDPWELFACGPDGQGPFRLVLYFPHGSITEYFNDIHSAFHAIEMAECRLDLKNETLVPNRLLIDIPDDVDLVRHCFSEETWAGGARH